MAKTQEVTVWYVTLPNGRKVEVDAAIAERYFGQGSEVTPFSKLKLEKVVKRVRVSARTTRVKRTSKVTRRAATRRTTRSAQSRKKTTRRTAKRKK